MNLKILNKTLCAIAVMALCAGAVNAQEALKQDTSKPALVDFSGVLFIDYSYLAESKDKITNVKTDKQSSINVNRVYLTAAKKIDDIWSVKVTLDGGTLSTNQAGYVDSNGNGKKDAGEASTSTTMSDSSVFVKNAYVQMAPNFGVADLKVQAGVVGTPIIGLIDGLTGSRWIYQNYIDKAKDITGSDIDVSSADTGLKADFNIMKMVTITGMYGNGDGYKTNEQDQIPSNKSYYGVINVTPIDALNIFGYYHKHNTTTSAAQENEKNFVSYMGAGAAWSDKAIKIGAAYTIRSGKAVNVKEESSVMELWANVNLQQFASVPVLLIGRYAMGTYEKKAATKLKNEGSAIWGGVGYQVNSNVQFAAMYKADTLTKKSAGVKTSDVENSTMFIKSEIKF
jgi:hypothetical protein